MARILLTILAVMLMAGLVYALARDAMRLARWIDGRIRWAWSSARAAITSLIDSHPTYPLADSLVPILIRIESELRVLRLVLGGIAAGGIILAMLMGDLSRDGYGRGGRLAFGLLVACVVGYHVRRWVLYRRLRFAQRMLWQNRGKTVADDS